MDGFAILIPLFPPLISILVPAILSWLRPRGLVTEAEDLLALVATRKKLQEQLSAARQTPGDAPVVNSIEAMVHEVERALAPEMRGVELSLPMRMLFWGEAIFGCVVAVLKEPDNTFEGIFDPPWARLLLMAAWMYSAWVLTTRAAATSSTPLSSFTLFGLFNAALGLFVIASVLAMRFVDPLVNWW